MERKLLSSTMRVKGQESWDRSPALPPSVVTRRRGSDNPRDNQPTGGKNQPWGFAGDPERLWTVAELKQLRAEVDAVAMEMLLCSDRKIQGLKRKSAATVKHREEIQEILLHAMVYAGIPRGVEGFRAAEEKLKEMGLE